MNTLNELLENGRLQDAARLAHERLTRNPGDPEALEVRVRLALREGRVDEALAAVSRATTAPARTVTLLRAGIALQQQDWTTARGLYLSLTQQDSLLSEAWYGLGLTHLQSGEAAQAAEAQRRAVALKPRQPSFRLELGRALALTGVKREAVYHLVVALRLEYADARPYGVLAGLLFECNHPRLARRVLEEGLRQVPGSDFLGQLATTLFAEPEPAPRDPREEALVQQVNGLLSRSRNRDALKLLRDSSAQGLRTLELKLLEAQACEALLPADLDGAERAFAEATALEPGNWVPHDRHGLFLLRQGGLRGVARAITVLEEAQRLEPGSPEAALHLAQGYRKGGRHAESAELATQLVQGLPAGHPLLAQAQALVSARVH